MINCAKSKAGYDLIFKDISNKPSFQTTTGEKQTLIISTVNQLSFADTLALSVPNLRDLIMRFSNLPY